MRALDFVRQRITLSYMAPERRIATFRLDDELLEGLKQVEERDGIPPSEQVRRAIRAWLEEKGVLKAERKRVGPRSRP